MDVVERRRLRHFAQSPQLVPARETGQHRPQPNDEDEGDGRRDTCEEAPVHFQALLELWQAALELSKCLVYWPFGYH